MSQLYDLRQKIDKTIEDRSMDLYKTRGMIALEAGFALGFISASTPDDNDKIDKLRTAAQKILGINL